MKKSALVLVIFVMATTAHASGDSPSRLQCGVFLGGTHLTYKAISSEKKGWDNRMNHVAGAVRPKPARLNTSPSDTQRKVEVRLPPKVTVATIGCSWR
jgi:hypothetical protein